MAYAGPDRRQDNTRDLVIETHTKLTSLCDFIMDNGQPGAISKINTRIDGVEGRVSQVESQWTTAHGWVKAIAWILGGLLTLVGTAAAMGWLK